MLPKGLMNDHHYSALLRSHLGNEIVRRLELPNATIPESFKKPTSPKPEIKLSLLFNNFTLSRVQTIFKFIEGLKFVCQKNSLFYAVIPCTDSRFQFSVFIGSSNSLLVFAKAVSTQHLKVNLEFAVKKNFYADAIDAYMQYLQKLKYSRTKKNIFCFDQRVLNRLNYPIHVLTTTTMDPTSSTIPI